MWILILVLAGTRIDSGPTAAITTVDFRSKESCLIAADAWLAQMHDMTNNLRARALCVSSGGR